MNSLNYLQSVKNGQLYFADGTIQDIPHWGDSAWTHFFCVRNADRDQNDLHDPGLSAEGEARAEHLGRILSEAGLDAVFATPSRRAQLTAEPVVRRAHTPPVETYELEGQEAWLLEVLAQRPGKQYLLIGHKASVAHLLNQLKGHGFEFDNMPNSDFGLFYVVATKGIGETEVLELRY